MSVLRLSNVYGPRAKLTDPGLGFINYFLGQALFEKGELARALKAYTRALEVAPGYLGALVGVGHALRLLGRNDEAIRAGRAALERAPRDPDALYLLGLTHMGRGDADAARRYLTELLTTRPEAELALEIEGLLQTLGGQVVPLKP